MFTDAEFEEACKELENRDVEGYEFFTESHDVQIYRQYNAESGLYSYKIYGVIDVDPAVCAEVYMDHKYRTEWDTYVKDLSPVKEGDKEGLYWQIKFPFPLSNRDYVYLRSLRELPLPGDQGDQTVWVILSRSDDFSSVPERSGVVRVTDYLQSVAMTATSDGKTKAYMHYYDNPGGMIPTWLINWAAKTGVPTFLEQMHTACKGYEAYKRKHAAQS